MRETINFNNESQNLTREQLETIGDLKTLLNDRYHLEDREAAKMVMQLVYDKAKSLRENHPNDWQDYALYYVLANDNVPDDCKHFDWTDEKDSVQFFIENKL